MRKDGRRADFEATALPHLDALYHAALSMTRNAANADDLVQETFLKAWRFWDKFKAGTSCKAWLFRIMTNTYINQYRRWSREPYKVDFDEIEEHSEHKISGDAVATLDEAEREAFDQVFSDEVRAAMESLPPYFRIVALLADVEGFSYQEIAEMIDVPIGTVRSRLSRARGMLQRRLLDYARERGLAGKRQGTDSNERHTQ